MLPVEVHESVCNWLITNHGLQNQIKSIIPLGGGSINEAFRIITSDGDFFLKYNLASLYPEMFELEMKGLTILAETHSVLIPEPLYSGIAGKHSYLLMKYVQMAIPVKEYWQIFAKQLALLHHNTANQFGLDHDNYIGSLLQNNKSSSDYLDFFINQRLQPLLESAFDAQLLFHNDVIQFERLFVKLNGLIPIEKPSLIHGDLWSGNLIVNHEGQPCLIDPAVYYGHRESDIAMTKLFGGFHSLFYNTYNDVFNLVKGWEQRIEIHQLYPLLVHVNLFGQSYVSQLRQIINKF